MKMIIKLSTLSSRKLFLNSINARYFSSKYKTNQEICMNMVELVYVNYKSTKFT